MAEDSTTSEYSGYRPGKIDAVRYVTFHHRVNLIRPCSFINLLPNEIHLVATPYVLDL